ncbi:MAG: response regulator [Acidobacteriota bacterium]
MSKENKVNILVVDDNEANRIAMQATLDDLDENIISVENGKKALRRLLDDEFAVVLLDVDMPVMDGFEVATLMRKVQKLKHTPIIFITALYQHESHIAKGYELGAVDYIFKPMEPEILKAKARFFIELHRMTAEVKKQAELLQETNLKLDDLNLNLERRVEERTRQLKEAVDKLEIEIVERKRVEGEREEALIREQNARTEAENANRLKDEFLATLSHELRTPLNAILGWVRILNSGKADTETAAKAMETIERNAKIQAKLIEDILDVSRIISGKFPFRLDVLTLDNILKSSIETLLPVIQAKNIDLQVTVDENISPIVGDSTRLQQAIWNLLSNAVKFTPSGGKVTANLQQSVETIRLQVSDTGQGIEPEFLPYIFDRFRQADGSMTRKHGGLGLGLAIVRHVVESHGGKVMAESPGVNQGATFTLEFPRKTLHTPNEKPSEFTSANKNPTSNELLLMLEGLRVLVVDDQTDTRELTCFMLSERKAEIEAAESVQKALEILTYWNPHIIVSDLGMPDEDGYFLIQQLRNMNDGKQIPALALTGYAFNEERERALKMGFQGFLTKPVNPEILVAEVVKLIAARAKTVM